MLTTETLKYDMPIGASIEVLAMIGQVVMNKNGAKADAQGLNFRFLCCIHELCCRKTSVQQLSKRVQSLRTEDGIQVCPLLLARP